MTRAAIVSSIVHSIAATTSSVKKNRASRTSRSVTPSPSRRRTRADQSGPHTPVRKASPAPRKSPDWAAPIAGPTTVRTSSSDDGPAGLGAGSSSTRRSTASGVSIAACSAMLPAEECPTHVARSIPSSRSSARACRA